MEQSASIAEVAYPQGYDPNDEIYNGFLRKVQRRFLANVDREPNTVLYTTDAANLFEAYLYSLPLAQRQTHNCNACRRFIETYGGLVTINGSGATDSALWHQDDTPEFYDESVRNLLRVIGKAKVTGVFASADKTWGTPSTGIFHHFSVVPPGHLVSKSKVRTPGQLMAEKREDYKMLITVLSEFKPDTVVAALNLLRVDQLYRAEKVLGVAEWLHKLITDRSAAKGSGTRNNLLWRAVGTAPAGFCHVRSSMIGTLLEDIESGLSFNQVEERFRKKMNPLSYQRPQAAPTAGNIAAAEKLVEKLGIAASLQRRIARVDEIDNIWTPRPEPEFCTGDSIFGHLTPKGAKRKAPRSLAPPAVTITWDKFRRTVLRTADKIEYYVPAAADNYCALTTAVDSVAPPILQWDNEGHRNPFAWYVWHGGSPARQWGLSAGQYVPVAAVTLKPSMWDGEDSFPNHGRGVVFILEGARETRTAGLALFPETLKAELREVRSTIEAHSKSGKMEGMREGSACGICFMVTNTAWHGNQFRVWTGDVFTDYKLDRWD